MTTPAERLAAAIHMESAAIAPQTSPLIEAAKEVLKENERLSAVVEAARFMPRSTPAPGTAHTVHDFVIPAWAVWDLDRALKVLDAVDQQTTVTGPPDDYTDQLAAATHKLFDGE